MTAKISYEQVKPRAGVDLPVMAPSLFIAAMSQAFGAFPVSINKNDIECLRGMAAMFRSETENNPYLLLIEAIHQLGEIRVFAEY